MTVHPPVVIQVDDLSRVGEARRHALAIASLEDLDEAARSNCGIIATELATNLQKHAEKGEIHLIPLSGRGLQGVEFLSIDRGPGIADPERCLTDGYSTAGTSGTGLGAVRRLANFFDLYSVPGRGTILTAQVFGARSAAPALTVGVAAKALRGETVSGDAWAVRTGDGFHMLVVADGLGHGTQASEASGEAIRTFLKSTEQSASGMLQHIHHALRGSRGAAVSVAKWDLRQRQVNFAGLGNVAGVLIDPRSNCSPKSMISHNGTAGHEARQFKEFSYPASAGDLLVLHSDGLSNRWTLASSPGLLQKPPSIVAGALYRDYARDRDDVCVIVGVAS